MGLTPPRCPQALKQVTWHGKGDYFATVVADNSNMQVLIHQTSKRWSQNPFRKSKGLVQCVLFHPIRPYFFVATQRYVRVYNLLKQELTKKLMANCKWVSSMAIHPAGTDGGAGTERPGVPRRCVGFTLRWMSPSLPQVTTLSAAAMTASWPGSTWTSPPGPTSCCGEPRPPRAAPILPSPCCRAQDLTQVLLLPFSKALTFGVSFVETHVGLKQKVPSMRVPHFPALPLALRVLQTPH